MLKVGINNPAASSGVCCSGKVFVSGFNTFFKCPKGRGIKPLAYNKPKRTFSWTKTSDEILSKIKKVKPCNLFRTEHWS